MQDFILRLNKQGLGKLYECSSGPINTLYSKSTTGTFIHAYKCNPRNDIPINSYCMMIASIRESGTLDVDQLYT